MKERGTKKDFLISVSILSQFLLLTVQYFVLIAFNLHYTTIGNTIQFFTKLLVAVLFLAALPYVIKHSWKMISVLYSTFFVLIVTNLVLFPWNKIFIRDISFSFFFVCIPSLIYSLNIKNYEIFFSVMKKTFNVILILGFFLSFFLLTGSFHLNRSYSMPFGYYMLFPMLLDGLLYFKTNKSIFMVKAALSLIIILLFGSRGAVASFIVFIVIISFINLIRNSKRFSFFSFIPPFVAIVAALNLNWIVYKLYIFFFNMGIRSRVLAVFIEGGIHWSGRDNLYQTISLVISENPIFGIGLAGDRFYLEGAYVHNIVFEILASFGIITGGLILIALLYISVKSMFFNNYFFSTLCILWFCLGFVPLLFSRSFLIDAAFWIFLGISIGTLALNHLKLTQ